MKKKKILFVISYFLDGGVETVLIEYLRNLLKTKAVSYTHLTLPTTPYV